MSRVRFAALLGAALLNTLPLIADEPKGGAVVAVGYGGRRLVSADGIKWDIAAEWGEKGGDDSDNLMSVVYAKGMFVAVGGGTPKREKEVGGHIVVSKDGKEWKEVYTAKFRVHPVLYGNDRFVAGGPSRNFLFSKDGSEWKEGAKLTEKAATHFRHGAFGNGVFVFIGNNGGDSPTTWAAVTKDGETLDHIAADLPRVRGLCFAAGKFVAVGPGGLRMSSKDGIKWEHHAKEEGADLTSLAWTGKEFLASGGKYAYSSADGVTWKAWPKPIPCHVLGVRDGVFVGTSWPGQMWHSKDGIEWKKCDPLTPNGINSLAFADGK
jgi:hypothetical protein